MKVWILEATDRNYDYGSDWMEGVFSSEEKALEAQKDFVKRWEGLNEFDRPRSFISEWEVDE